MVHHVQENVSFGATIFLCSIDLLHVLEFLTHVSLGEGGITIKTNYENPECCRLILCFL